MLHRQLDELAETPYFSADLDSFINQLREILDRLLAKLEPPSPSIDLEVARLIGHNVWELTQFLTGSTTKQVPYEVVYAIERAAAQWTHRRLLITTAIVQEANFFFKGGSQGFFGVVESELGVTIDAEPVQIALPYIYRHKPLFCIPLFHELGHYVDVANDIIKTTLLQSPDDQGPDLPELKTGGEIGALDGEERMLWAEIVEAHRREYFADVFSASYVGYAAREFLVQFCGDEPVAKSHPSTKARFAVMDDFLNGRPNAIVDMFQAALRARGLGALDKRYAASDANTTFASVRPCLPKSDKEVFGLFQDGWTFLHRTWATRSPNYASLAEAEVERVVNDLTEKSIRNRIVTEDWDATAHRP